MKIVLVHQGKTNDKSIETLEREYLARLAHYASIKHICLPDSKGQQSISALKQFEEENLLKLIKPGDIVLLFDEKGKTYSSVEFAQFLQRQFMGGKTIFLVTGGAFGFSEKIYERANGMISLSLMTFTHQMVRAIIAEQLYRAFTILKNEKYHH